MTKRCRSILLIALLAGLVAAALLAPTAPAVRAEAAPTEFPTAALQVHTRADTHVFQVELAVSERQHRQGLMFRRQLAPDAGMLFVNPRPVVMTMWMKNTFIPLDMIFIRPGGEIAGIVQSTVPQSRALIPSGEPIIALLELNAGTAARLNIRPGDRVVSPVLPSTPAAEAGDGPHH